MYLSKCVCSQATLLEWTVHPHSGYQVMLRSLSYYKRLRRDKLSELLLHILFVWSKEEVLVVLYL